MRLVSATFKNFRLLHNVSIDFSLDESRPLTVIRGENGCGKTTTLDALRWLLYGEQALPSRYRIADANQKPESSPDVLVVCEGVFLDNFDTKFRIKRTVREDVGTGKRGPDSMVLYQLDDKAGWTQVEHGAEVRLRTMMPESICDIFFTNGDDALVFIEAAAGERRSRVEAALKEMLGIEIVESALKHVRDVSTEFNRAAKKENLGGAEFAAINDELKELTERIDGLTQTASEADKRQREQRQLDNDYQEQIESELRLGDREQLLHDLKMNRSSADQLAADLRKEQSAHAELLSDPGLSAALLRPAYEKAWSLLEGLKVQGEIPTNFSAILLQCVGDEKCICGSSLTEGTKARKAVDKILADQRERDDTDNHLMDLRFECSRCLSGEPAAAWRSRLDAVRGRLVAIQERISRGRMVERELEAKLENLKDSRLNELRSLQKATRRATVDATQELADARAEIRQLEDRRRKLELEQSRMTARLDKQEKFRAQLEVSSDVERLFSEMRRHIVERQIRNVSDLMSAEFLRMIGADSRESGITEATITESFDLVVRSQEGDLNPDTALNGASKRALTLAFILALSEVSQVAAPNVIDTPLGMMAGAVKRAVLANVIERSSQPVLFLTSSEISGCEDLIAQGAGVQQTLTNTGAGTTKNPTSPVQTLRCKCGIDQRCAICEVIDDFEGRGAIDG